MNYDHLFHAGNFADVVKHITLTLIITYLKKKPSPFRIVDTHAGAGLHDLTSDTSRKNPEWQQGIAALRQADLPADIDELIEPYLDLIAALNPKSPSDQLVAYPGSPIIAHALSRPHDRLSFIELHPDAFSVLKSHFSGDIRTKLMNLDAYQALPAQLPPKEKRGIILIDPPFEQAGEFDRMVTTLVKAHRHFATGVYCLWYPLKDEAGVARFKKQLHQTGIPSILASEFHLRAPSAPPRLFGTGMVIVNPPFVLKDQLDRIFAQLLPILSTAQSASFDNSWIREE